MAEIKRNIAYKIRIGDMISGNIMFDGDRFSSLEVKNKKISRVNVVCNVVDKYSNPEKNYNSLTIDDGTGQIRVKGFSDTSALIANFNVGDTIKIIGLIKHFNNELYILPEIAVRVDAKWAYVRKLELVKEFGEFVEEPQTNEIPAENISTEKVESEKIEESSRTIILKKIKEDKEGIDVEKLIMSLKFPVNEINEKISELIADGEVYEPKPGHLRSLD